MRYHRDPDPIAVFLLVTLIGMIIAALLGGCGWADNPAASESASVVRPLRTEETTTTSTSTTTTTVAPTTTTRCTEEMPCWDCETMGNGVCGTTAPPTTEATTPPTTAAPEPPPPPAPAQNLLACAQGLASAVEVIPGGTSWAHTSGLIQIGQWHLDQGGSILCWTVAHEAGHLYAYKYGTQAYLGAPPEGFYSGDVEHWADCAAFVWTGYDRGGCGAAGAASAAAVL